MKEQRQMRMKVNYSISWKDYVLTFKKNQHWQSNMCDIGRMFNALALGDVDVILKA